MNNNAAGSQAGAETSLRSIEELIQSKTGSIPPEVREYMYLGAKPFFRYYLERSGKYLGEDTADKYRSYLQEIEYVMNEDGTLAHPLLIDVLVKLLKDKFINHFEAFLYTVFIIPMEVVRARSSISDY